MRAISIHGCTPPPPIISYFILHIIYYQQEVRRGDYWGLGVFLLQYFPLVNI